MPKCTSSLLTASDPPPALGRQDTIAELYKDVATTDWTSDEVDIAVDFFRRLVEAFIPKCLGVQGPMTVQVFTGCRPSKFSLHVVVPELVFEANYLSGRYVVWEFARYTWGKIGSNLARLWREDGPGVRNGTSITFCTILRLSMLHEQADSQSGAWRGTNDTPVDEVVYSRNNQFRLVGNSKRGKHYPLVPVGKDRSAGAIMEEERGKCWGNSTMYTVQCIRYNVCGAV